MYQINGYIHVTSLPYKHQLYVIDRSPETVSTLCTKLKQLIQKKNKKEEIIQNVKIVT